MHSANLYYLGFGTERDYNKAAELYLGAALDGNTDAQINIAHFCQYGFGVPKDKLRAFAWLTHARRGNNEATET